MVRFRILRRIFKSLVQTRNSSAEDLVIFIWGCFFRQEPASISPILSPGAGARRGFFWNAWERTRGGGVSVSPLTSQSGRRLFGCEPPHCRGEHGQNDDWHPDEPRRTSIFSAHNAIEERETG
jgi:hypothetical protein